MVIRLLYTSVQESCKPCFSNTTSSVYQGVEEHGHGILIDIFSRAGTISNKGFLVNASCTLHYAACTHHDDDSD